MSTEDRLKRILAMVPWIVAHDGPTVDETCERFGCTPPELMRDIELLYMCGLYPYIPTCSSRPPSPTAGSTSNTPNTSVVRCG